METMPKHAAKSTTIQGIVGMVLAVLVPLVTGETLPDAEMQALIQRASGALALVAAWWAARGRSNAKQGVWFLSPPDPRAYLPPDPITERHRKRKRLQQSDIFAPLDDEPALELTQKLPTDNAKPPARSEPAARKPSLTHRPTKVRS